jgi:predicted membrane protein (TIGR00267 family)
VEILKKTLAKIRLYIVVTHISDIARRYFVKNGMDGSMTVLGIILGGWAINVDNPKVIVVAGLGACLAMGISGLFGAYVTEKAERKGQLNHLEESMLVDLDGTLHHNASQFVPALAALVDGVSPALTATISLIPFLLSILGLLSIWSSYVISLILTFITLFALGLYLGRVAKGNMWFYGLQMLAAGFVTTAIMYLFGGTILI